MLLREYRLKLPRQVLVLLEGPLDATQERRTQGGSIEYIGYDYLLAIQRNCEPVLYCF